MSNIFPIRILGYRGTEFEVSREAVLDDYAATVRQFDDLTMERREEIISEADDETLRTWFMEQWTLEDAVDLGKRVTPWPGGNKKTFTNNMHMRGMAGDYEIKP